MKKTNWGYIYQGIKIAGSSKAGSYRVRDNLDASSNNTYKFSTLKAAKAFVDRNWSPMWIMAQDSK